MLHGRGTSGFRGYDFANSRYGTFIAPIGVRLRPLPLHDPFQYTEGIYVEINNVDRTRALIWDSLEVTKILTRQVDTCRFSFLKLASETLTVNVNDNVKVYDTRTLIFQGIITSVKRTNRTAATLEVEVEAVDYMRELDSKAVFETYEDQTAEYIVKDIILRYAPQFTTDNVYASQTISHITFNYETVAACLTELAEIIGYDWWVDEYKDVHFRDPQSTSAPFVIEDDDGEHLEGSLEIMDDISQLRNVIYLRGGDEVGSEQTYYEDADGEKLLFPVGYHFSEVPTVDVASAAQTVGTEGVDAATDYDCLWNPTQDYILFKTATKPAVGELVEVTGTPLNPILMKYPERNSIAEFGERHMTIIDKTIITRDAARQRARAEILKYAQTLISGRFATLTKGVEPGQAVEVDSDLFGVQSTNIVTQVKIKMLTPKAFHYEAIFVSTKLLEIVDLMILMLREKYKEQEYASNEDFAPVEALFEEISIVETITTGGEEIEESITVADSASLAGGTGLNFGTIFVLGPWTPSGVYRQLNLDNSPGLT